jgi:DNA-binding MarR family transcriptional regulator
MSISELHDKPGNLIRRVQQIAVAVFMRECAGFDITPVQYAVLIAIRENPGLDATRVCPLVSIDRSTMGNLLERLEGRGLIRRSPDPRGDKRVKVLALTAAGDDLLKAVGPAVARAQDNMIAPLPIEERQRFLDDLRVIIAARETAPD